MHRSRIAGLVLTLAVAALACGCGAGAGASKGPDTYQVHVTPEDNDAAGEAVLQLQDLDSEWKQTKKAAMPARFSSVVCDSYHPSVRDLVVTGGAAISFLEQGAQVTSSSLVFKSPEMLAQDWERSVGSPNYLTCERATRLRDSTADTRFVSFEKLDVPSMGTYSIAYRLIYDVRGIGPNGGLFADDILHFGIGRTEITLSTIMHLSDSPELLPGALVMARRIAWRVARSSPPA